MHPHPFANPIVAACRSGVYRRVGSVEEPLAQGARLLLPLCFQLVTDNLHSDDNLLTKPSDEFRSIVDNPETSATMSQARFCWGLAEVVPEGRPVSYRNLIWNEFW